MGCEPQNGGGPARAALLEATAAFAIGPYAVGADPAAAMFPPAGVATGDAPVRAAAFGEGPPDFSVMTSGR